ncbi:MAG TPA: type II secretion system F family protein [Thermaerobacter sp.]
MNPLLFAGAVAAASGCAALVIVDWLAGRWQGPPSFARLAARDAGTGGVGGMGAPRWVRFVASWPWPVRDRQDERAVRVLARAGLDRYLDPGLAGEWVARLRGLVGVAGAGVLAACALYSGSGLLLPVAAVAGLLGGREAAWWFLERRGAARQVRVVAGLPEWLENIALAARGGLSLRQCLEVANAVGDGPLVEDARQAMARVRGGQPLREALLELARRYTAPELSVAVRSLIEAEHRGMPVAETAEDQVQLLRELANRYRQRHIDALPFWLSLITILLLLPPVFVVTLLPNVLTFLQVYR